MIAVESRVNPATLSPNLGRFLVILSTLAIVPVIHRSFVSTIKIAGHHNPKLISGLKKRLCLWVLGLGLGGPAITGYLFRSPIFGLLGLVTLPWLPKWTLKQMRRSFQQKIECSSIGYLYALRGLTHAGLSLPSALFLLSEQDNLTFASELAESLARYQKGHSLSLCLDRFRTRSGAELVGSFLVLLEMAYREGLPIVPLLDCFLPMLESERVARRRIQSVKRTAAAQAAIAFFIPWIVGATLYLFQPEIIQHAVEHECSVWIILGVIAFETTGVCILWECSRFV